MVALPAENAICPICGSPGVFAFRAGDYFYKVTDFRADLFDCQECHGLFQWPRPDARVIATFYPSGYWRESGETTLLERLQALYVACILRLDLMGWFGRLGLDRDAAFLDIGCGRGDWLAAIEKRGFRVFGLEADGRAVDQARRRFGLKLRRGDVDSWHPEPESFDAIAFFHLLEHLPLPHDFLQKCRTALRPDGRLLLRVPNLSSLQYALLGGRWKGLEMPRHLVMFRPGALERLLKAHGFHVDRCSTWSLRDGPPALTSSLFPRGEPTRQQILGRFRPFSSLIYLALNTLLTPLEWGAAACGKGAMLTVIAYKR